MSLHLAGISHLSPSGAATLVDCNRRYWWRYKQGLGKDERSEPMAMGGGLAAALEHQSIERGVAEYYDRRPVLDGWTDPVAYKRAGWIGEATIKAAEGGYISRWPDTRVLREQTYLVALPAVYNLDRVLQVRVDGLLPGYHLIEDKLRGAASMRAPVLENEVLQGRQLTAEIYAHWRTGGEILPVMFRVMKKCDPRKLKGADTWEQVEEIIVEHFASDGVFNEYEVTRTEGQLVEFEREFAQLTRLAGLLESETPAGVRNEKACFAYGRVCPALLMCQNKTEEIHDAA